MTFTTLQSQTSYSGSDESPHDLKPIGTDEAEALRYAEIMGNEGTLEYSDDLYESGLVPDDAGYSYGTR